MSVLINIDHQKYNYNSICNL